jgi:hypothetical protein
MMLKATCFDPLKATEEVFTNAFVNNSSMAWWWPHERAKTCCLYHIKKTVFNIFLLCLTDLPNPISMYTMGIDTLKFQSMLVTK